MEMSFGGLTDKVPICALHFVQIILVIEEAHYGRKPPMQLSNPLDYFRLKFVC